MLVKIISGGQTGADRAALDAAMEAGIDHGGWIPSGRRTEDGPLPRRYRLQETASAAYPRRTEKNILASDGTLVFTRGRPSGGSALTISLAGKHRRPVLHLNLARYDGHSAAVKIYHWIEAHRIRILNVAGCRESKAPGIYRDVYRTMELVIGACGGKIPLTLFSPGNNGRCKKG